MTLDTDMNTRYKHDNRQVHVLCDVSFWSCKPRIPLSESDRETWQHSNPQTRVSGECQCRGPELNRTPVPQSSCSKRGKIIINQWNEGILTNPNIFYFLFFWLLLCKLRLCNYWEYIQVISPWHEPTLTLTLLWAHSAAAALAGGWCSVVVWLLKC